MLMHFVNLFDVSVESKQAVVVKLWDDPLVYAKSSVPPKAPRQQT